MAGIRVNTNIFSLFVNRNLLRAGDMLTESYERVSSGYKINKAGDDPAGLATSHALSAKISGLQRTMMNCEEGLNLLAVSESSLANVTDMLQRMRELAVQASNDTYTDAERLLIQKEIDELVAEIDRVGGTTNYNEKNLLDGTFANLRVQVGTRIDENIPITIEDSRASALGWIARLTGTPVDANPITALNTFTINGITVPETETDGVSSVDPLASAIAKAAAINRIGSQTGVRAYVEPTVYESPGASVANGSLDGTASSLTINGFNIGPVAYTAGDPDGALRDTINSFSSSTGVVATLGAGGALVLTAQDGRNVDIQTTGGVAVELGLATAPPAAQDVSTVATGQVRLVSAEDIVLAGNTALVGMAVGTTSRDPATSLATLNVTTNADAQEALERIEAAQSQVLARRARLGAIESRLDKTLEDIQVNIENLTSANSRIRDADFAVETARLTQAQIIQEAGVAILSQANMVPRMALNLLEQ